MASGFGTFVLLGPAETAHAPAAVVTTHKLPVLPGPLQRKEKLLTPGIYLAVLCRRTCSTLCTSLACDAPPAVVALLGTHCVLLTLLGLGALDCSSAKWYMLAKALSCCLFHIVSSYRLPLCKVVSVDISPPVLSPCRFLSRCCPLPPRRRVSYCRVSLFRLFGCTHDPARQ